MLVIDADCHLIESPDLWSDLGIDGVGWNGLSIQGRLVPKAPAQVDPSQYETGLARVYRQAHRDGWSCAAYETMLDEEGIDRAVLFPTRALGLLGTHVPRDLLRRAIARYTFRARLFTEGSRRLFPVGLLSREYPDLGPECVQWAWACGFAAVVTRPNPVGLAPALDSPAYEETWAEAARLGLPVIFHEGTGADRFLGSDRATSYMARHAMSHPFEMMAASQQLILGGVLERHPRLRLGFFEAGAGWVPYWLDRLDGHASSILGREYTLPLLPSLYFLRQCAVTLDAGEADPDTRPSLRAMFASDLPHGDSAFPHARRLTSRANHGRLDVMGGRAKEFFSWTFETHGGVPCTSSIRTATTAPPSAPSSSTPSPGSLEVEAYA